MRPINPDGLAYRTLAFIGARKHPLYSDLESAIFSVEYRLQNVPVDSDGNARPPSLHTLDEQGKTISVVNLHRLTDAAASVRRASRWERVMAAGFSVATAAALYLGAHVGDTYSGIAAAVAVSATKLIVTSEYRRVTLDAPIRAYEDADALLRGLGPYPDGPRPPNGGIPAPLPEDTLGWAA